MFQGDVNDLLGDAVQQFVDYGANAAVIGLNFGDCGPIGRLVGRSLTYRRVDSELEEFVEMWTQRVDTQRLSTDQIPVEGLQVPQIEHHPVPLGDGARVERVRDKPED